MMFNPGPARIEINLTTTPSGPKTQSGRTPINTPNGLGRGKPRGNGNAQENANGHVNGNGNGNGTGNFRPAREVTPGPSRRDNSPRRELSHMDDRQLLTWLRQYRDEAGNGLCFQCGSRAHQSMSCPERQRLVQKARDLHRRYQENR